MERMGHIGELPGAFWSSDFAGRNLSVEMGVANTVHLCLGVTKTKQEKQL